MKLELEKKSSRDFIYKQSRDRHIRATLSSVPCNHFYEKNIDVSRQIFTICATFVSFRIFIEKSFPFLSPFFLFSFFFFKNLHT